MRLKVLWTFPAAFALLLSFCCFSSVWCQGFSLPAWPQSRTWEEAPLTVEPPIRLHVRNQVGRVVVRGEEGARTVTIRVRAEARGWPLAAARRVLDAMRVHVRQEGSEVWVEAEMPRFPRISSRSLALEITVPRETSLDLRNDVGEIRVEGIRGTVDIEIDVGAARLEDVVLTGDSRVVTNVGEVHVRAALPSQGEVRFRTDVGAITATVQSPAALHVVADTGVGQVVLITPEGRLEAHNHLEKDLGPQPATRLVLETGTGAITVRVGK